MTNGEKYGENASDVFFEHCAYRDCKECPLWMLDGGQEECFDYWKTMEATD